jgi:hypothetical protein
MSYLLILLQICVLKMMSKMSVSRSHAEDVYTILCCVVLPLHVAFLPCGCLRLFIGDWMLLCIRPMRERESDQTMTSTVMSVLTFVAH